MSELAYVDLRKEENKNRYYEGMMHWCEAWQHTPSGQVFVLGYYQIFSHYYFRVRDREGNSLANGQAESRKFLDAYVEFGQMIATHLGEPLDQRFLGPKERSEREEKAAKSFETELWIEPMRTYAELFTKYVDKEAKSVAATTETETKEHVCMFSNRDHTMALLPSGSLWLRDQLEPHPVKVKITPRVRCQFKDKERYYGKRILHKGRVYAGHQIYEASRIFKGEIEFHANGPNLVLKDNEVAVAIAPMCISSWGEPIKDIVRCDSQTLRETVGLEDDRASELRTVVTNAMTEARQQLEKKIEDLEIEGKKWYSTLEERINGELGHSGTMETYLMCKAHLSGIPSDKVWDTYKCYLENKGMYAEGKGLIV